MQSRLKTDMHLGACCSDHPSGQPQRGEGGRPFVFAQQQDTFHMWLLTEGCDINNVVDEEELEQFVA